MSNSILVLIAMSVATAAVAAYRKLVARDEDDFLHVSDPTGELIAHQRTTDQALRRIDRVGIGMTIATVTYAITMVALFLYNGLTQFQG